MYVNIDRNTMTIVHKHRDVEVVRNLSWIECQSDCVVIACGSVSALLQFDVLQLQRLYEQATGHKLLTYANHMARLVADLTMRMPESAADLNWTQAQKLKIGDGDKTHYRYVHGSVVPDPQKGGYRPDPIRCSRNEALETATAPQAPTAPAAPAWQPTAADREAAGITLQAQPSERAQRAPSAPRAGGTRDIVFGVADRMWEEAGKPTVSSEVLALRKLIMTELEANHGVKRTTSSNTLGDWQKARIIIQ